MAHAFDHTLEDEIEVGNEVTTVLTFRRPRLDDFVKMEKRKAEGLVEMEQFRLMVCDLTGKTPTQIGMMGVNDMAEVQRKLTPFLKGSSGKGGKTPN